MLPAGCPGPLHPPHPSLHATDQSATSDVKTVKQHMFWRLNQQHNQHRLKLNIRCHRFISKSDVILPPFTPSAAPTKGRLPSVMFRTQPALMHIIMMKLMHNPGGRKTNSPDTAISIEYIGQTSYMPHIRQSNSTASECGDRLICRTTSVDTKPSSTSQVTQKIQCAQKQRVLINIVVSTLSAVFSHPNDDIHRDQFVLFLNGDRSQKTSHCQSRK